MEKVLYIFPDTNLFIQCRPLTELDWTGWSNYKEIQLVITRPVQREIDTQKNRGNERVGQRARKAAALFREIIIGDGAHVVREKAPRVSVYVKPEYTSAANLREKLDYSLPDDQLVGVVAAFLRDNPTIDALLLTHDTGPMATAKMVNVPFSAIPEGWLLPPERTESEKELAHVKHELTRLRKAEPELLLKCVDQSACELDRIDVDFQIATPLHSDEISKLIDRLRAKIPKKEHVLTGDGSAEDLEHRYTATLGLVYRPPSEEEVNDFFNRCEEWLKRCREFLLSFHQLQLTQFPTFNFLAFNDGSRPALDVLVTIEARGNFELMPHEPSDSGVCDDVVINWPDPPTVPAGRFEHRLSSMLPLMRSLADFGSVNRWSDIPELLSHQDTRRDPNAFYWKPSRPVISGKKMTLECEQWRHGIEAEEFSGRICFSQDHGDVRGAVECTIHAANMADAANCKIPVRISISRVKIEEQIRQWVDSLVFKHE